MLKSNESNSCSGQAIMELLPAMMMFFVVLFACLAYFRAMRSSVMREEAVRNVAFAKINNSGTLTTTLNQTSSGRVGCGGPNQTLCVGAEMIESGSGFYSSVPRDRFVRSTNNCFVLNLEGGVSSVPIGPMNFNAGGTPRNSEDIKISTYAVVHRKPGGWCGGAW